MSPPWQASSPLQQGMFLVYPIQHEGEADEGLGKGVVEVIQLNCKNEGEINVFLATLLSTM
jgi:hypothetical protein